MSIGTVALAVATALGVATSTLAAPASKDPSTLILKKGDFPAHFFYDRSGGEAVGWPEILAAQGVRSAKEANYGAGTFIAVHSSKTKSLLMITGIVVTTASVGDAKKAFRIMAQKKQSPEFKPVSVPAYGDTQSATYSAPGSTIQLLVRKRSVLWYLRVSAPRLSESELLADLKPYAAKQKDKIKAG